MAGSLTVRLEGADAALGRVRASDVANLIIGLERTVRKASGQVLRRPVKATGRREKVIEEASEFRLVALRPGSVVLELELPELTADEEMLDVGVGGLAELGLNRAADVLEGITDETEGLAAEWAKIGDSVGIGSRFDRLVVDFKTRDRKSGERRMVMDDPTRRRLHDVARAEATRHRVDALVGTLVEADFESRTAHLRTASNERIKVEFDDDSADAIQDALRQSAEFIGEVTYEPATNRVRSVRLRSITRTEQLSIGLGDDDFWRSSSLAELIEEQGVDVTRADDLFDDTASPDEVEMFMAILEEM